MNFKLPSTIQELKLNINNSNNIKLFIKREDLIHNVVSGNKWRKLNYNFKYIKEKNKKNFKLWWCLFQSFTCIKLVGKKQYKIIWTSQRM